MCQAQYYSAVYTREDILVEDVLYREIITVPSKVIPCFAESGQIIASAITKMQRKTIRVITVIHFRVLVDLGVNELSTTAVLSLENILKYFLSADQKHGFANEWMKHPRQKDILLPLKRQSRSQRLPQKPRQFTFFLLLQNSEYGEPCVDNY